MYEAYSAMGETGFNSTVCGVLAAVLCDQGRFEEAAAFARRSRELAAEDDFASQSEWRTAEARVLLDRGRFDEALRLADEAIEISDVTDYLDRRADCHEVRGLVLGAAGRGDDARAAYGEALALYRRKGNLVAAARVRKRIEGVSGSVAPT
jgi:tetratricopeptide (TPR) repeat protein